MGVVSRRVLPICASFFCFSCPSLRPSSRKPTKRYKKYLKSIYEKDGSLNERSLNKMCDYGKQNPDKLIIIITKLEKNALMDLKFEDRNRLQTTTKSFSRLLASCKEQMPLLAESTLNLIRTFLEKKDVEINNMAYLLFSHFTFNQVNQHYASEIDKVLPGILAMMEDSVSTHSHESGASVARQTLTAAVWYTHQFSYLFSSFSKLLASILDQYDATHFHPSHSSEVTPELKLWKELPRELRGEHREIDIMSVSKKGSEHPELWSQLSLLGLCQVASKDVTQAHLVMGPALQYLHNGSHWGSSLGKYLLTDLHYFMADAGKGDLFLDLVSRFAAGVAERALTDEARTILTLMCGLVLSSPQAPATPTPVGPTKDLCGLLIRSFQQMQDSAGPGSESWQSQKELAHSVQDCLSAVASKMSSPDMILNELAFRLDSLSSSPKVSAPTLDALTLFVSSTAHPLLQNLRFKRQAFPDALLLSLVQTMTHHPDAVTRTSTHLLLSALLLAPSPHSPPLDAASTSGHANPLLSRFHRSLSRAFKDTLHLQRHVSWGSSKPNAMAPTPSVDSAVKPGLLLLPSPQLQRVLLSSIFLQTKRMDNNPENYVAMANLLAVVVSLNAGDQDFKLKAMQMILSARTWALSPATRKESGISAVRLRSVLTMTTSMFLTVSHKSIFTQTSVALKSVKEDGFLSLGEDGTLSANPDAGDDAFSVSSEEEKSVASTMIKRRQSAEEETKAILRSFTARERSLGNVKDPNLASRLTSPFQIEDSYFLQPPSYGLPLRSMEIFTQDLDATSAGFQSPNSDFGGQEQADEEVAEIRVSRALPSVEEFLALSVQEGLNGQEAGESDAWKKALEALGKSKQFCGVADEATSERRRKPQSIGNGVAADVSRSALEGILRVAAVH